jgi:hypothetical protein
MHNNELELKAKFIFGCAFDDRGWSWDGPRFHFDRDSLKPGFDSGPLKGQVMFLSSERLDDREVSANELLEALTRDRAQSSR